MRARSRRYCRAPRSWARRRVRRRAWKLRPLRRTPVRRLQPRTSGGRGASRCWRFAWLCRPVSARSAARWRWTESAVCSRLPRRRWPGAQIRALKDSVAQLRPNLKAIGDNVAAVRAGLNASFSSSTAQFAKIAEAIEKLERHQGERHVAAAPPPAPASEATGSIAPAAAAKPAGPGVVEGWVLRKAYRGAALVEGRYGIIEIEPGDHLPGVGRVEEIKRQDGHWVVVTARGLIVGLQ